MDNIFGIKFHEEPDTTIKIWVDKEIKEKNKKKSKKRAKVDYSDTSDTKGSLGGNKKTNYGRTQATERDERVFRLQTSVEKNEITTVQQAIDILEVSKVTIISYLKEIGIQLYDEEDKKNVGLKPGEQRKIRYIGGEKEFKNKVITLEYYDKNPYQDGKKIEEKDYLKIKRGEGNE